MVMVKVIADQELNNWDQEYQGDPEYISERLAAAVAEAALGSLKGDRNQSWLAQKMGVPRSQVSRMLKAPQNMTLLTVARVTLALGMKVKLIPNSEDYLIMPLNENPTYEEFKTAQAMRSQTLKTTAVRIADAQATVNGTNGEVRYATA